MSVGGILVAETGLVVALGLVAGERGLLPLAGVVLSAALVAGFVRVRGTSVGEWAVLALRHRLRPRTSSPAAHPTASPGASPTTAPTGGDGGDVVPAALRAVAGPAAVVASRDHDGRPVALLGAPDGAWSAVLVPAAEDLPLVGEPPVALAGRGRGAIGTGSGGVPLGVLADALVDRGVVLDAITLLRHTRAPAPDGATAAREARRAVLGPLPDLAHRSTWIVVRLHPDQCPEAVAQRGGGDAGARRAVIGALARLGRVLAAHGLPVRPLDPAGVADAVAVAAACDLDPAPDPAAEAVPRWDAVVVGEVGHSSWAVSALAPGAGHAAGEPSLDLDDLAAPDAVTTVALTLRPDDERDGPGDSDGPDGTRLDGPPHRTVDLAMCVRVSARTPAALATAGRAVVTTAAARGVRLDPLSGRQTAALRATLPWGDVP